MFSALRRFPQMCRTGTSRRYFSSSSAKFQAPAEYFANENFLKFQLFRVLNIMRLKDTNYYQDLSKEEIMNGLATSIQISQEKLYPHSRKNDTNEPHWDTKTGEVIINKEVYEAIDVLKEAGFFSLHADYEMEGIQLPSVVTNTMLMPLYCSNVGTMTFPFLTIAAGNMLKKVGTKEQWEKYLLPMLQGRYFGTMNLSEPQAGSSLGDITTKAEKRGDGLYSISGTKMWISGGEQSISENIVHMVLAKTKGSDRISLFIVPKYRIEMDGEGSYQTTKQKNGIELAGLNHKMGWRGATNCVLNYGEETECLGEILGKEGEGLKNMFNMMNEARISVGVISAALGYAGYARSLAYAKDRKQGRLAPKESPTPIVNHLDVKKMLLLQKSYVEGAVSLCLYGSFLVDELSQRDSELEKITDQERKKQKIQEYEDKKILLDLLTPIIKSWPAEYCLEANKWSIQIHGGYGYTRDYDVEQIYRDNRLNMIHEGTNGIQSIDLLGRKVTGRGYDVFRNTIYSVIERINDTDADANSGIKKRANQLNNLLGPLEELTLKLTKDRSNGIITIDTHEYLDLIGNIVIAWQWLEMESKIGNDADSEFDSDFLKGIEKASNYYFVYELPKAQRSLEILTSTDMNSIFSDLEEENF